MSAQGWSAIIAAAVIVSEAIWIIITLRIKNEIMEKLDHFGERVEAKYSTKEACERDYRNLSDRMTRAGA